MRNVIENGAYEVVLSRRCGQ